MAFYFVNFFNIYTFDFTNFPTAIVFSACAILFSIFDIKNGEVPRIFSVVMLFVVLLSNILIVFTTEFTAQIVLQRFFQTIIDGAFALLTFAFAFFICKGKMGLADVWFSCAMGMVLGVRGFIIAALVACVIAFMFYCLIFASKKGRQHRMSLPFIPFLSVGFFVVLASSIVN